MTDWNWDELSKLANKKQREEEIAEDAILLEEIFKTEMITHQAHKMARDEYHRRGRGFIIGVFTRQSQITDPDDSNVVLSKGEIEFKYITHGQLLSIPLEGKEEVFRKMMEYDPIHESLIYVAVLNKQETGMLGACVLIKSQSDET